MRKFKVNVKMKLCKTGLVLEMICFGLAIATVLNPRFWPIFTFSVVDFVLVHLLAFYFEVKEVSE
jgi:uncharacterized membrane protein